MSAAWTAFLIVLAGYAFAHIDDGDALYYRDLGRGALERDDPFHLRWSQLAADRFIDHLPPGPWLAGALDLAFGEIGSRLLYAAMSAGTVALLCAIVRKLDGERIEAALVLILATTEGLVRLMSQQRLDPPFLLCWTLAVFIAVSPRVPWWIAGGAVGLASLFRPPQALGLLVLVPFAAVLAKRRLRAHEAIAFVVCSALPLAIFHAADVAFARGDAIHAFVHAQLFASFTGERADGATSHFAPLIALGDHFWPGNVGLVACVLVRKKPPRALWLGLAWGTGVLVALSLGKRHLWTHAFPAYLALAVVAAWGMAPILEPLFRRVAKLVVFGAAAWAITVVVMSQRCDVLRFSRALPVKRYCEHVLIADHDWALAHRVQDHWRRPVRFGALTDSAIGCAQIAGRARGGDRPEGFGEPAFVGRDYEFWIVERQ